MTKKLIRIDLDWFKLTDNQIIVISNAIETNYIAKELYIRNCQISQIGIKSLSMHLNYNMSLTYLGLSENNLGNEIAYIKNLLVHNKSIKTLLLARNRIGCQGMETICQGLVRNQTLKFLDLSDNVIHDLQSLIVVIKENESLQVLDLHDNHVNKKSVKIILESMKHNTTITTLWLNRSDNIQGDIDWITGWNSIGNIRGGDILNNLPLSCRDRIVVIVVVLKGFMHQNRLHWIVLNMLQVKNVVKIGYPEYNIDWL